MIPVDDDADLDVLVENIAKIARVKNLLTLSAAPGQESGVELTVGILDQVEKDQLQGKPADYRDDDGSFWRREKSVAIGEMDKAAIRVGQLLDFSVRNTSNQPYYLYLVDIMSDGTILPFYPPRDAGAEFGLIKPGASRLLDEVRLSMENVGTEYLRMIVSRTPIDIYQLEEDAPPTSGAPKPLEALLAAKVGHAAATEHIEIPASEWSTVLGSYAVAP